MYQEQGIKNETDVTYGMKLFILIYIQKRLCGNIGKLRISFCPGAFIMRPTIALFVFHSKFTAVIQ